MQANLYPSDHAGKVAFEKILNQKIEKPPVKMNATNVKNIDIIWNLIKSAGDTWRGKKESHVPGMPMDRKKYWGEYARMQPSAPLPLAVEFLMQSAGEGKVAIDLGCGNGPATALLLERGWRVIAVDSSSLALAVLGAKYKDAVDSGRLTLIEADILTYIPEEPADLVLAADILSYVDPAQFRTTWMKIHDSFIKPQGFLIGNLHFLIDAKRTINGMKEQGAWFLYDERMVEPLLTSTGYDIKKCQHRDDGANKLPICKQFIAQKK